MDARKVSVMLQLAPGASTAVQELPAKLNAEPLAPPNAIVLKVTLAVPVLVTVSVCGALVEPALALKAVSVEKDNAGAAAAVPVPFSVTVCGEPAALSVSVTVAVAAPTAVGVKVMATVQVVLGASELPQALANVNAEGVLTATLESVSVALPVLVSVRVWLLLAPIAAVKVLSVDVLIPGVVTGVELLVAPPPPQPAKNSVHKANAKVRKAKADDGRVLRSMGGPVCS